MLQNNIVRKHEKLYLVEQRIKTFRKWPYGDDCKCNVRNMAEAGFYSISTGDDDCDSAKCFLCGKELDGWEPTDDPWTEHKNHAAHCAFVQLGRKENDLLLSEFLAVVKQYFINEVKRSVDEFLQFEQDKFKEICRRNMVKK